MSDLLLIVTVAGERVALPAASVESVVELDLDPVPRAAPHVAGLSALRSRGPDRHRLHAFAGVAQPIVPTASARRPSSSWTGTITR